MTEPLRSPSASTPEFSAAPSVALPQAEAVQRHWRRLARAESTPWLHEDIAARMAQRLPIIKLQPKSVIQWGARLGGGHDDLRQHYPQAHLLDVEPSDALLLAAQEGGHTAWWAPWRKAARPKVMLPSQLPAGAAELVWANMFLHHAPDHLGLLQEWHRALAVDGFLMFSCLGPDSFVELRQLFDRQAWGPTSPPWVDMHDLGDMLVQVGFGDPVMDQECITLTWGDPQTLLADLRALGGNAHRDRFAGWRTPAWRKRLIEAIESMRRADGRIAMRLEVIYGHAFKPQPKIRMDAETRVSLDDMRAQVRQRRKD